MIGSGINMYLIPKNIKTKREIFKGFGILEIIAMGIACGIGFLLQALVTDYKIKIVLYQRLFMTSTLREYAMIGKSNGSIIDDAKVTDKAYTVITN